MFSIPFGLSALLITCLAGSTSGLPSFVGQADEVTSLPGVNFQLNYRHYSGYLSSVNGTHLHYWFFESQSGQSDKDPVALWLTGGPGCSSLYAELEELGPIRMNPDGTLSPNRFAWNQKVNILFLESPAGVGFSYKEDGNYYANDDITVEENFGALQSFFTKFPHLAQNDFYVIGESYAGIYIPTLSVQVIKRKFPVNFKGIAIGNGLLDRMMNAESSIIFASSHGLIDSLSESLQSGQNLRIKENVDIDVYNILANCYNDLESTFMKFLNLSKMTFAFTNSQNTSLPSCSNSENLAKWLNDPLVKKALHIDPNNSKTPWRMCGDINYEWQYSDMAEQIQFIVDSGVKTLIYNGDLDMACNFIGDRWFVESLGYKEVKKYGAWYYDEGGYVGGFSKVFEKNLFFTTVRGAGHMVPQDKPGPALQMFNQFVQV